MGLDHPQILVSIEGPGTNFLWLMCDDCILLFPPFRSSYYSLVFLHSSFEKPLTMILNLKHLKYSIIPVSLEYC